MAPTTTDPPIPLLLDLSTTRHLPVLITWPAMLVAMVTTIFMLMFRTKGSLFPKPMGILNMMQHALYHRPPPICQLMKCYRGTNTMTMVM